MPIAKRYIVETGSIWLRSLLDPSTDCSIYVVRVTAERVSLIFLKKKKKKKKKKKNFVLQQTEQDPEHHIEGRQRVDALENLQVIRALGASEGSVSHNGRAWRE